MLLLLFSCQPDIQVAPESQTPSWVDTASAPSFTPNEGEWIVRASTVTLDECGLEQHNDRGTPGNVLRLVRTGPQAFEVTLAGGETPSCTLADEAYTCASWTEYDSTAADLGLDATMPAVVSVTGAFESEVEMLMTTRIQVDCEGDSCELVGWFLGASFPCTTSMDSWVDSGL